MDFKYYCALLITKKDNMEINFSSIALPTMCIS